MADRPIIFSGPMVRALLDGRKTQTRRLVRPCEDTARSCLPMYPNFLYGVSPILPSDKLWVREKGWERPSRTERMMRDGADTWEPYAYDADGISEDERGDLKSWGWKRRPSIHMPRWASRLTLIVTDVRVQRLQEISEEDAVAEGVDAVSIADVPRQAAWSRRQDFAALWDSINASRGYGWGANPWVVALTFTVHRGNIDAIAQEAA